MEGLSLSPGEAALAYLRGHNVMTLATTGPSGLWSAAVFYVNDGFALYFVSAPTSRHAVNLEAHPAVSATIQEDYKDWTAIKGIQLEGEARRVDGADQARAQVLYTSKFSFLGDPPTELARALSRIAWYTLVPRRLYFIDNARGFGHRDEVTL